MRRALPIAALLGAVLAAASARVALEPAAEQQGRVRDPAWLPDGHLLRAAALGQRLLLADLYWLKLVQYVGENTLASDKSWEALYPLAEIVTDLDPRYGYAYQVAGSNLSGLAGRIDESNRILEKGIRAVPDRWSLPFLYAFNKFYYEGDFKATAEIARKAARLRPSLALLATNLSLVSDAEGEYAAAQDLLAEAMRQAETDELRRELAARQIKVRTYAELSRLERAIARYQRATGRRPVLLVELVAAGILPGLPDEPSGGAWDYDPVTGVVKSTVLGARRPLRVTAGSP